MNRSSRNFILLLSYFTLGFFSQANAQTQVADSSKKLLASAPKVKNGRVLLREQNVVYPKVFEKYREQSTGYVEQFANKKSTYIQSLYQRGKKLTPKIQAIFRKYGVPSEMALLMGLESSYNSKALSSAGASGYWQFMDGSAKMYGLKIIEKSAAKTAAATNNAKPATDDRHNFTKSTYAAAKYLRDLSRMFNNDWLLVAAAYNYGPGNLRNVIRRVGSSNFWAIKNHLPSETRNYVQNLIALNVVHKNYNKFLKKDLVFEDILGPESGIMLE